MAEKAINFILSLKDYKGETVDLDTIKENLENTINKARELNADFIGVTDDGNMGSKSFKINADVKIIGTGVIK